MTDLVGRCIDAATEVPEVSYGNGMYDADIPAIVRAVLAEAGVAELTATIDAQAAEIARLRAIMADEDGICDAIMESMDEDWSCRDGAIHVVGWFEIQVATLVSTGAA